MHDEEHHQVPEAKKCEVPPKLSKESKKNSSEYNKEFYLSLCHSILNFCVFNYLF